MQDIQEAIQNSISYLQFTDKLANINNKLFFTVTAKEQKGLQRAIAFMYYTMDALDDLGAEGLIKGASEKAQFGMKTQKAGFSFLSSFNLVALSGDSLKKKALWVKVAGGVLIGVGWRTKNPYIFGIGVAVKVAGIIMDYCAD